ncbi:hypothetical protein [Cellulomonas sp. NPDC089187]|uniref:hypothetical protein n=1 Tax=Cellulomonas sp. NPDC089187 TaxID=3154970 RepID=UPI003417F02E
MKMTLEEFRRLAKVPRLAGGIAAVVGSILVLLLIYNARSAAESMDDNPWASFWDLFWVTNGTNGSVDPVLVVLVWGPVVLLPVILVLVVIDLLTHESRVDKVYDRYLADGWLAEQVPTGIFVKSGRARLELVVLSGPGQPPAQLAEAAARAGAQVNSWDRKQRRAWDGQIARVIQKGFQVGGLLPELPPMVLGCARRGKSPQAIVIGASGADAPTILAVNEKASLGQVPSGSQM